MSIGEKKIQVTPDGLAIHDLTCTTADVVKFFREVPDDNLGELVCRALAVGVTGLRAAGITNHMLTIEHEFGRMVADFANSLGEVERRLVDRVETTFDPEKAGSVTAHIGQAVNEAHDAAAARMDSAKAELQGIIKDSFNPDLATSAIARLFKLVNDTRVDLERLFDPSYEDSYLSRLIATVDGYFGDSGGIADIIAKQLQPVKDALERQLQEVRDAVTAQGAAAAVRRKSPLSGGDFEDEVEELLRFLAQMQGDTVERVGNERGDEGASKKGDFVVTLREGLRFVVESKDHSSPITLRGDRGILKALDDSMTNRGASFAICVMKEEGGFPKEVGVFNDYDSDKVLCSFGPAGELLEVAYRWARATILAEMATDSGLDVQIVRESLDEVRASLRELKKIEAKAKAIVRNADDIYGLVTFQIRRAQSALDTAEQGLHTEERAESA